MSLIVRSCFVAIISYLLAGNVLAQNEDKPPSREERFAHLKTDNYTARVVDYWLDPRVYGGVDMTMPKDDPFILEGRWVERQGEKIFPVMVELFKLEDDLRKKNIILSYFKRQSGDNEPILAEVRKVLPEWENKSLPADNHIPFVTGCLKFLAVEGDDEDKALIQKFIDNEDGYIGQRAKQQLVRLEKRLAREKEHSKIRNKRGERPAGNDKKTDRGVLDESSGKAQISSDQTTKTTNKWPIILAIILVLGGAAMWIKSRASK